MRNWERKFGTWLLDLPITIAGAIALPLLLLILTARLLRLVLWRLPRWIALGERPPISPERARQRERIRKIRRRMESAKSAEKSVRRD